MRHGYVIELKYLKRSASATEERVAAAALPGRRTLGAAVPIGALHRPGARLPRLGTGPQRRDSPPADLKIARCAHPRRFLTARSIPARGQRPRRSTRRPSAAATANYGSPQGVARWGTCIAGGRVVEGSECRGRRREGAPAAAAAAKSTGGPVAGRGSRLGTATQRPLAGTLDCSRGGRRFGGPEGAGAEETALTGTYSDFRGVPWSTPAGLEGPLRAAERPTLTPSGRLTAKRRRLMAVEGPNARKRRRDSAHAAAAANSRREPRSAAVRPQRSIPPR